MIKWNEITWYSRLGAIVLFIGVVPTLSFYLGVQYQAVIAIQQSQITTISPIKVTATSSTETTRPAVSDLDTTSSEQTSSAMLLMNGSMCTIECEYGSHEVTTSDGPCYKGCAPDNPNTPTVSTSTIPQAELSSSGNPIQ